MKQAIEEGFILDVLANYTTYKSYYEIQKSIEENPLFDSKKAQKKLAAMYVDKKLQNVLAVQALSRLNHSAPMLGKKTEDLFILDFFNTVDDIKNAFDNFYTATSLSCATDVNVLHELKESLDDEGVYEWHDYAL